MAESMLTDFQLHPLERNSDIQIEIQICSFPKYTWNVIFKMAAILFMSHCDIGLAQIQFRIVIIRQT